MKSSRLFSFALQIIIWGLFIAQPYLNKPPQIDHYPLKFHIEHNGEWLLYILFFYFNYLLLIPSLLGKNKVKSYFIISLCTFLIVFFLVNILEFSCFGLPPDGKLISFFSFLPLAAIYSLSLSLRMLDDWLKTKTQREQLTLEKRNAELSMMRLQVSPHFLFNSLNNINALVRFNPAEAEKYIVQLSSMMRYVLKAGKEEKASLEDELNYLRDYIGLQKLRLSENFNVSFAVQGDTKELRIEPLLLIGFVENAFKHGIAGLSTDFIRVKICVENTLFSLEVSNSIAPGHFAKDEISGIGEKNAIGRMNLVYPGKFECNSVNSNGIYKVNVKIDLR